MSRVGVRPVPLPDGVKVSFPAGQVQIEGGNGKLTVAIPPNIRVEYSAENKALVVKRESQDRQARADHGTIRAHLANAVRGVTQGFQKDLRLSGVGYTAALQGGKLSLSLGFSHPVQVAIPLGLTVTLADPTLISIRGADRQRVGQFAAQIRAYRPIEPYNLKGIRYSDEIVKKKQGKTFVSGA